MKREVEIGQVDYSVLVFIPDPASTDGSGKTGLVAANLTVSYTRVETDNDVTVTDVTGSLNDLALLTTAHTDWGLKEVSNTLAPGLYRLDIADAVFATGAWTAVVYVMITTSAAAASPMEFVLGITESSIAAIKLSTDNMATASEINAPLVDDPRTEPGTGAPPVNPDMATKIDYLYKGWRNRKTQTSTAFTLYNDDATTAGQAAAVSDDGTTFDRGEIGTG